MKNICIIKLGALGDVVRTLPVAAALKKERDVEITWVTRDNALHIFEGLDVVDEVVVIGSDLTDREFDVVYNYDVEDEATELAKALNGKVKIGFSSEEGFPVAFNPESEYYLNTIFDDVLKKDNRKTYQRMMFELAGLVWDESHVALVLKDEETEKAKALLAKQGFDSGKKLVGLHIGASKRWPSKRWADSRVQEFLKVCGEKGWQVMVFAGLDEAKEQEKLNKEFPEVLVNDPGNSIRDFAALVHECDVVVSGDSFALHVALSLHKPTVGLFFCTSPHEIEDYGLLTKIVSPLFEDFFPERMDEDNEELKESIFVGDVVGAVEEKLR